jgi:hypothetical protein
MADLAAHASFLSSNLSSSFASFLRTHLVESPQENRRVGGEKQ